MGKYLATEIIKLMIKKEHKILNSKVLQLGITFKENCPDIRNSHAAELAQAMRDFGCIVDIFDPWADPEDIKKEYQLDSYSDLARISGKKYDVIVLAVAHREFLNMDISAFKSDLAIVYDIKSVLPADMVDDRL